MDHHQTVESDAAEALRSAADDYEQKWGLDGVPEWLRERADRVITPDERK